VLAAGAALARHSAARLLRRATRHIGRLAGLLLLASGGYVAWYGLYELRVAAGQSAGDPVIDAAAAVQNTLAAWVDRLGPWPIALAGIALAVLGATAALRRRARTGPPAE
jgi:hypothetical protein